MARCLCIQHNLGLKVASQVTVLLSVFLVSVATFHQLSGSTNCSLTAQELEEDPEMRSKVALYKDPAHKAAPAQGSDVMTDGDDDEDDLPDIPLEELLDDMNALQLEENGRASTPGDEDEDMEG